MYLQFQDLDPKFVVLKILLPLETMTDKNILHFLPEENSFRSKLRWASYNQKHNELGSQSQTIYCLLANDLNSIEDHKYNIRWVRHQKIQSEQDTQPCFNFGFIFL